MSHSRLAKRRYKSNVLATSFMFLILLVVINLVLLIAFKAPFVSLLAVSGSYVFSLLFIFKVFDSRLLNFFLFLVAIVLTVLGASMLIGLF